MTGRKAAPAKSKRRTDTFDTFTDHQPARGATMFQSRTRSLFRPHKRIDQSVLKENRKLVEDINRRGLLRGAVSLGALTMLTGCDVTEDDSVQKVLRAVSAWNDGVQEFIFRPDHLAPTFSPSQVVKPARFNAYYDIEDVKPVDGASWKLELAGRIANKQPWTAQQIYQLPEQEIIIRHVCVEGWDYIGQWSGVNLRGFFERVGADTTAKYVYFICNDDYTESIDMATALHPQTLLATKYAGDILADPFGYPLRLRTSTKLGYKNAKWIKAIEVTNDFRETFWSKQGFNWFAGI
jgi:DMSO/TMAO reductase YedYZ molybdopterin-dependent catalytic subunit